ncbi:MAG TPA: cupin domain-containing protein [Flavobacterium sp.]|jgi:mannose-6-phosphate isomerase-like protein (cupin superfamily)
MKGYNINLEKETLANNNFRRVLYTAKNSQLVLMSLKPNEDIGAEIHEHNDQFLRFEAGQGKVIVDDTEYKVGDGDVVIVPAGAKHNVINTSDTDPLKLYTVYSPPDHKDGLVHKTKADAENDIEFDGETTEDL